MKNRSERIKRLMREQGTSSILEIFFGQKKYLASLSKRAENEITFEEVENFLRDENHIPSVSKEESSDIQSKWNEAIAFGQFEGISLEQQIMKIDSIFQNHVKPFLDEREIDLEIIDYEVGTVVLGGESKNSSNIDEVMEFLTSIFQSETQWKSLCVIVE